MSRLVSDEFRRRIRELGLIYSQVFRRLRERIRDNAPRS